MDYLVLHVYHVHLEQAHVHLHQLQLYVIQDLLYQQEHVHVLLDPLHQEMLVSVVHLIAQHVLLLHNVPPVHHHILYKLLDLVQLLVHQDNILLLLTQLVHHALHHVLHVLHHLHVKIVHLDLP